MQLNELKPWQKFTFANKGLNYGIDTILFGMKYKSCNNKIFKYIGNEQYIQIDSKGKQIETAFNCFIWGRGENKKLYYEDVVIID